MLSVSIIHIQEQGRLKYFYLHEIHYLATVFLTFLCSEGIVNKFIHKTVLVKINLPAASRSDTKCALLLEGLTYID